jgi:hypothetical protein
MHSNKYKSFNIFENTPNSFYKQLNEEFNFNFDPCPENPDFDGLIVPWTGNVYINPPYGKQIKIWLEKALFEIEKGNCDKVVFLLPAYTDVKWFHEIILPLFDEIRFIKGRLRFGSHNNSAPFASMLAIKKFKGEKNV